MKTTQVRPMETEVVAKVLEFNERMMVDLWDGEAVPFPATRVKIVKPTSATRKEFWIYHDDEDARSPAMSPAKPSSVPLSSPYRQIGRKIRFTIYDAHLVAGATPADETPVFARFSRIRDLTLLKD